MCLFADQFKPIMQYPDGMLQQGRTVLAYALLGGSVATVQYLVASWDINYAATNKVPVTPHVAVVLLALGHYF